MDLNFIKPVAPAFAAVATDLSISLLLYLFDAWKSDNSDKWAGAEEVPKTHHKHTHLHAPVHTPAASASLFKGHHLLYMKLYGKDCSRTTTLNYLKECHFVYSVVLRACR